MSKPSQKKTQKKKDRERKVKAKKANLKPASIKAPSKDPYLVERLLRRTWLLNGRKTWKTEEEVRDLWETRVLGRPVEEVAAEELAADVAEQAQELAFQALAWLEDGTDAGLDKADRLSRQARALDPDCVDAVNLGLRFEWDEDEPLTAEQSQSLARAIEVSRTRLNAIDTSASEGHLPSFLKKPHVRLLDLGLDAAEESLDFPNCVAIAREIFELDPELTHVLPETVLTWLLHGSEMDAAKALLERFGQDDMFLWWRFWIAVREGDTALAEQHYAAAVEAFPGSEVLLFSEDPSETDVMITDIEEYLDLFASLMDALPEDNAVFAEGRRLANLTV
jgi:hypothetical protein